MQREITVREYSWLLYASIRIAACGCVVDQLHEGKGFFSSFSHENQKIYCLVCFALCLKIISHFLEYIELKVTLESKTGLSPATKHR
jgi:hypothetical protein